MFFIDINLLRIFATNWHVLHHIIFQFNNWFIQVLRVNYANAWTE